MVNTVTLEAQGSSLFIELNLNERGWSRLYLRSEKETRYLGADVFSVIAKRLLSWLHNDEPQEEAICIKFEQRVRWITSLSETHHVLYGTFDATDCIVFVQDAQAPFGLVGTAILSEANKQDWDVQLQSLTVIGQ